MNVPASWNSLSRYVLALHQTSHDDFGSWVNGSIDGASDLAPRARRRGPRRRAGAVRRTPPRVALTPPARPPSPARGPLPAPSSAQPRT